MERFPLICGFRDFVEGNGFLAEVIATGRALAVKEEDAWWMYGVNPGGIAASGASMTEAHLVLRQEFKKVLLDIAADAASFDDFKAEAESFFGETNASAASDWKKAVEDVRSGAINLPLPRAQADSPLTISVVNRHDFSANKNRLDDEPRVAA